MSEPSDEFYPKPKVVSISRPNHDIHQGDEQAPDLELIKCVESLLEKVKSGEITGISVATFHKDKAVSGEVSGLACSPQMIGELFIQAMRIAMVYLEEDK